MTARVNLDELEALLAKATPGPWVLRAHGVIVGGPWREYTNGSAQAQIASFTVPQHSEADDPCAERDANTRLAATAPVLLAQMAAELRDLRARMERAPVVSVKYSVAADSQLVNSIVPTAWRGKKVRLVVCDE